MEVDMLILSLILIVFVLLILTILVFLWYSGIFRSIEIKTCKPPFKSLEIAYKFSKGPYRDSGILFTEAHSIAPDLRCIGIYYDNPIESDKYRNKPLRYIIGLIVNDEKSKADDETRAFIQAKGFTMMKLPEVEHVVYASFPHRSSVSVVIAISRVLPKFREYVQEKGLQAYPIIELCDGQEIVYVAPLSKQDEFFVPEALAESDEEPTSDPRTLDESDENSGREVEDLPNTASSIESLPLGSRDEELPPSVEFIDSLAENGKGLTNGSEASTESFEELQLDS